MSTQTALMAFLVATVAAALAPWRLLLSVLHRCPPALSASSFAILHVGQNFSEARHMHLPPSWLPLPLLADELEPGAASVAWAADGVVIYCRGDATTPSSASASSAAAIVYVSSATTPWQWPAAFPGEERVLEMPPLTFEPELDDESSESPAESAVRLVDASATGAVPLSRRVTLQTLSVSPPIFRVRGLLTEAVLDALERRAAPEFEPSTVGLGSVRKRDERRASSSAWLHGYQDPSQSVPAARSVQRAVVALLRQPPARLSRGVEPLLAVQYAQVPSSCQHRHPSPA